MLFDFVFLRKFLYKRKLELIQSMSSLAVISVNVIPCSTALHICETITQHRVVSLEGILSGPPGSNKHQAKTWLTL